VPPTKEAECKRREEIHAVCHVMMRFAMRAIIVRKNSTKRAEHDKEKKKRSAAKTKLGRGWFEKISS
jgi:hypothetical protein